MPVQVTGISFVDSNKKITVSLEVDKELKLTVIIPYPDGDKESWTVGQIKALAIVSAGSKIPRQ
ncbi:hypothetical protein EHF36_10165 [Kerstersia gyiorum]|uniref:hypothetical protein n=1 Tax=Kerstersia gyiorum TaxID=206506 RepID=UPI001070E6B7|nr:hypothetical protein [Kerstersia gyiorum]QBR40948.1 hypothetical protein EHF36_10165 [Kerstersia gyiorum]